MGTSRLYTVLILNSTRSCPRPKGKATVCSQTPTTALRMSTYSLPVDEGPLSTPGSTATCARAALPPLTAGDAVSKALAENQISMLHHSRGDPELEFRKKRNISHNPAAAIVRPGTRTKDKTALSHAQESSQQRKGSALPALTGSSILLPPLNPPVRSEHRRTAGAMLKAGSDSPALGRAAACCCSASRMRRQRDVFCHTRPQIS